MYNSRQYKHIIWDWNGTLLDDGWLFVDIMNTILKRRGMDIINLDKYRNIFGFPVKEYYMKLGFDLQKESFEESGMEFIRGYKTRRYEAKLYPEVIHLLNELKKKQISHSILSAQHQKLLDDLTKFYKIHEYFIEIIGLDNHFAHSKVNNGINWVKKLDFNLQEVLMIGDTGHDYEVANAIGIDCILLSHGHYGFDRLKKTGAIVFQNLREIYKFFNVPLNKVKPNKE